MLHSDICGSIRACRSPQLFAAYHVLRRLPMPRHSPCALISLTIFFLVSNYARFSFEEFIVVFYLANNFLVYVVDTCFFPHCIYFLALFNFQGSLLNTTYSATRIISSATPRILLRKTIILVLVGTSGLEPPTSRLSGVRSNHLSYAPI